MAHNLLGCDKRLYGHTGFGDVARGGFASHSDGDIAFLALESYGAVHIVKILIHIANDRDCQVSRGFNRVIAYKILGGIGFFLTRNSSHCSNGHKTKKKFFHCVMF